MPEMPPQKPPEAVKIDDNTYRIEDGGVRCVLYIGTEKALLFDTGFGENGSVKSVVESLTSLPVMLVNSHADPDHIGNNAEFDVAYMHPAEMAYYAKHAKADAKTHPIWEGDVIDLGGRSLEVVLIPGHTPGSVGLLDRKNRTIATGDTISAGPVFMFDEVRSIHAYMASMYKLIGLFDAFDTIFPAHGQCPVPKDTVNKALAAAEKLLAGELSPVDPPMPIPAKMYLHDGVGFFY